MLMLAAPLAVASNGGGPNIEVLSGTVYDEHGRGKGGALVNIDGTSVGTASDDDGRFLLTGEDLEGPGTLVVSAVGYLTARVGYELADGGRVDLSVYLVEAIEPPGTVEGTVTSFEGIPIQGALVTAGSEGELLKAVLTDVDGHYSITDLPAIEGAYFLSAEAGGYSITTKDVIVRAGETSVVDLVLAPEIPMELVRGLVTDGRGLPLPGALVTVEGSSGTWSTDVDGHYSARVEGRLGSRIVSASLRGYRDSAVTVIVPEPGVAWANLTLKTDGLGGPEHLWVMVTGGTSGGPVADTQVTVEGHPGSWQTDSGGLAIVVADDLQGAHQIKVTKASHTIATTEVHLEDGGTAVARTILTRASNAVTLTGVVLEAGTDRPLVNAWVSVDASGLVRTTRTDQEGSFTVHNLPPGVRTIIIARASGFTHEEMVTTLDEYELNTIAIRLDRDREDLVDIEGSVTDIDSRGPVVGAQVTLRSGHIEVLVRTDDRGAFFVEGLPVRPGEMGFRVDHRDHRTTSGGLDVPADGSPVSLDIDMERLPRPKTLVRGLVRDPDGFAVEDATVAISTTQASWSTLSLEGYYELYLDVDAHLTVEASANGKGYGWHNQTPLIRQGAENWVNFTLPLDQAHSNVLGRVVTPTERPLGGAEVMLTLGGAYHERTTTDALGAFCFRLVPSRARPYQLSAVAKGFSGATVEVVAEPGMSVGLDLVVQEDITTVETLHGRVVNIEGSPMASAVVQVGDLDPLLTDANGSFVLVDTELDGFRTVQASSPGFEGTATQVEVEPGGEAWVQLVLHVMDAKATSVGGRVVKAATGGGLGGATVRLGWAGASTWTYETVTGPDGDFTFHGVPLAWGSVAITATRDGFHDDGATVELSGSEGLWVTFSLRRVVVEPPEEPGMTVEEKRAVGAGVGATLAALAAIVATEVGRVALLGLLLLPLYTKIKRDKVMDHFVRGRIYEYICNNPGVNYSAIKERFDLTNGTVTYHLSMLERQEFITAKRDGIYKRYFKNGGGASMADVEPMSVQLSIAKAVRESPGMTQKEIAKRLGTSKQLVSYHIRKMKKARQLETRRDGRSMRVFPNHQTPE